MIHPLLHDIYDDLTASTVLLWELGLTAIFFVLLSIRFVPAIDAQSSEEQQILKIWRTQMNFLHHLDPLSKNVDLFILWCDNLY